MKNNSGYILGVLLGFVMLFSHSLLKAQVIEATSEAYRMNFGFPELQVLDDLQFLDENDNNIIDPGEGGIISFTVENKSKYTAYSVTIFPSELNNLTGLELPEKVELGDIDPGGKQTVQIAILARADLEEGTASLIFEIFEKGDYENLSVAYTLNTAR